MLIATERDFSQKVFISGCLVWILRQQRNSKSDNMNRDDGSYELSHIREQVTYWRQEPEISHNEDLSSEVKASTLM